MWALDVALNTRFYRQKEIVKQRDAMREALERKSQELEWWQKKSIYDDTEDEKELKNRKGGSLVRTFLILIHYYSIRQGICMCRSSEPTTRLPFR